MSVIDTSAIVALLFAEPGSDQIEAKLVSHLLHSPAFDLVAAARKRSMPFSCCSRSTHGSDGLAKHTG